MLNKSKLTDNPPRVHVIFYAGALRITRESINNISSSFLVSYGKFTSLLALLCDFACCSGHFLFFLVQLNPQELEK